MLVTLILIPMSIVSAADSGMKIVVSDTTVSKGTETATVTLTLSGNTGTCGMLISIAYPEELTLLKAERGDALPDLTLATFYKPYINPLRMSLDGIDNDYTNGTLLTLTFDTSDAAEGEYPIKVTYRDGDIYDGNFAHLSPAITNGSVTIAKVTRRLRRHVSTTETLSTGAVPDAAKISRTATVRTCLTMSDSRRPESTILSGSLIPKRPPEPSASSMRNARSAILSGARERSSARAPEFLRLAV